MFREKSKDSRLLEEKQKGKNGMSSEEKQKSEDNILLDERQMGENGKISEGR